MAQSLLQTEPPPLVLEPVAGPSHKPLRVVHKSEGQESRIGRQDICEVQLIDPFRTVSRSHATLRQSAGVWQIRDNGSSAGTFVGGQRVDTAMWTTLRAGDSVVLGAFTFVVKVGSESATTVTSVRDQLPAHTISVIPPQGREVMERRQLQILLQASASLNAAADMPAVAAAVLKACLEATGYTRASLISAATDAVEVVATRCVPGRDPVPSFSRTILAQAMTGRTVQMSGAGMAALNTMIGDQVAGALCIPVKLDSVVDKLLYLDSDEGRTKQPLAADAAAFSQAIAELAGLALSGINRRVLQEERQRHRALMEAALGIQVASLPPVSGRAGGLEYSYRIIPARDVAGDLFDMVRLTDDTAAFWFGDVSGKGVVAALLGAMTHAFLAAAVQAGPPEAMLSQALTRLGTFLETRCAGDKFVSLFCGIADRKSGQLTYVDAGHGYWAIKSAGTCRVGESTDPPMRVAEPPFHPVTVPFGPGDRLVLVSDGVVEQSALPGGKEEIFGFERLVAMVADSTDAGAIPDQVVTAVRKFSAMMGGNGGTGSAAGTGTKGGGPPAGGVGFDDDLSVACLWFPDGTP
jgi:serine phosphatase RsbU (regulator of sigma subunit)